MEPVDTLIQWIESVAPDLRDELAGVVQGTLPEPLGPDLDAADLTAEMSAARFITKVRSWCADNPTRQAGTVAAVSAVIDMFIATRAGKADWAENKELLERLRDVVPDLAENALRTHPLKSRQWMAVARGWQDLRGDALSPGSILDWMLRQPLRP